jgi:hypothetical protein
MADMSMLTDLYSSSGVEVQSGCVKIALSCGEGLILH